MPDDQQHIWADEPDAPTEQSAPWRPDEPVADETIMESPYAQLPARTWPGWPPPIVEADAVPYGVDSPYAGLAAQRMPRVQAVDLARQWKRRIAIGSVLTFGLLAGLAAAHTVNATTSTGTTGSDGASGAGGAATQPAAPSNPGTGGFFGQPGDNGGISPNGSSAPPVTSSQAS